MPNKALSALSAGLLLICSTALAGQPTGVTPTEIKVGQTMPYSGPVSPYGVIGRANAAYFDMVNEKGGVNGRKINFISLDDAYSPPKTVEQTRRLVEQDEVAVVFASLGTPTGLAVRKYLNSKKVPRSSWVPAPAYSTTRPTSPGRWAGNPTIVMKLRPMLIA